MSIAPRDRAVTITIAAFALMPSAASAAGDQPSYGRDAANTWSRPRGVGGARRLQERWAIRHPGPDAAGATYRVAAVAAGNGQIRWSTMLDAHGVTALYSSPAAAGDRVVVGVSSSQNFSDGTLRALAGISGRLLWRTRLPGPVTGGAAVAHGTVLAGYACSSAASTGRCIPAPTPRAGWSPTRRGVDRGSAAMATASGSVVK